MPGCSKVDDLYARNHDSLTLLFALSKQLQQRQWRCGGYSQSSWSSDAQPAVGILEMMEITSSKTSDCLPSHFCEGASARCAQFTVNISCWRIIECLPFYRSKYNYLSMHVWRLQQRYLWQSESSHSSPFKWAYKQTENDKYTLTTFNKCETEMTIK